jgi:hypothetical protein
MAVRLALGETHVIEETKKMLRQSGVNIAALEVQTLSKAVMHIYVRVCIYMCIAALEVQTLPQTRVVSKAAVKQ